MRCGLFFSWVMVLLILGLKTWGAFTTYFGAAVQFQCSFLNLMKFPVDVCWIAPSTSNNEVCMDVLTQQTRVFNSSPSHQFLVTSKFLPEFNQTITIYQGQDMYEISETAALKPAEFSISNFKFQASSYLTWPPGMYMIRSQKTILQTTMFFLLCMDLVVYMWFSKSRSSQSPRQTHPKAIESEKVSKSSTQTATFEKHSKKSKASRRKQSSVVSAQNASFTTHQLVKCVCIVTMILDHIGRNFFPSNLWWRVCARATGVIFYFLVGFNTNSASFKPHWRVLASYAFLSTFVQPSVGITTLFSLYFLRRVLPLFDAAKEHYLLHALVICLLLLFHPYVDEFLAYGSRCILYGMVGRTAATRSKVVFLLWYVPCITFHALNSFVNEYFPNLENCGWFIVSVAICLIGLQGAMVYVYDFRQISVFKRCESVAFLVRKVSHFALEIYVGHLVLIEIVVRYLGLEVSVG